MRDKWKLGCAGLVRHVEKGVTEDDRVSSLASKGLRL